MIRSAMRTLLRDLVGDKWSITWTDAQCDARLNMAAHVFGNILSKGAVNFARQTVTITTNAVLTSFILTGKSDLHSAVDLIGGPGNCGGTYVPEDKLQQAIKQHPSGIDADGRYLFYLTFNALNTSSPWTLVFVTAPPAGTWTFVYNRRITEIPTGAGAKERQTLTRPTTGSHTITWHGVTTAPLDLSTATAAEIKTALLAASPSDGAAGTLTSAQVTAGGTTTPYLEFENSVRNLTDHTATLELMMASAGSYVHTTPGADGDDSTYPEIPAEYHEALVECAAIAMLGHDGSATVEFAKAWYGNLMATIGGPGASK